MAYISTRGESPAINFDGACLAGLAPDGGLYVPYDWPKLAPASPGESYRAVAARILSGFAGDVVPAADMARLCDAAYAAFSHHSVAPLVQAGPDVWLMELHHGPTLAFKDVAMQVIARLYDHLLAAADTRMTIVCATSGDTGGAAAAAFAGSKRVRLVILHPSGRVSGVQRQFMTTTGADNVLNLAVEGDFDDCQAIVKQLFADRDFAATVRLSGVNSINWARIAAQSAYYAAASAALGGRAIRFVVPSGNLGDALAGYVAARCGLLAGGLELLCAVNENDTLVRLFGDGELVRRPARETPSPAMDISLPSNFERLLFEASGRNPAIVRAFYQAYAQSGHAVLPDEVRGPLGRTGLRAVSVSNGETLAEIERVHAETGYLICPHTAVGTAAARRQAAQRPATTVVLATAAAAKFPETVTAATGRKPELPPAAAARLSRPERMEPIAAEFDAVRRRISGFAAPSSC